VKEIRRKVNVPLIKTSDWGEVEKTMKECIKDIKKIPGIDNLFTSDEIYVLIRNPSVADTVINIMHARLKRCVNNPITKRTLQDLLYKSQI
jgi:hypothetical protein